MKTKSNKVRVTLRIETLENITKLGEELGSTGFPLAPHVIVAWAVEQFKARRKAGYTDIPIMSKKPRENHSVHLTLVTP